MQEAHLFKHSRLARLSGTFSCVSMALAAFGMSRVPSYQVATS